MRTRTTLPATAAGLLLAALTACSGPGHADGSGSEGKPAAVKSHSPKTKPSVDCSDQSLDQATWVKNCSGKAGTGGDGTTGTKTLAWGKGAMTVGAQSPADGGPGGGALEVTPTTVVYAKTAMGSTAANGTFAVITVKDEAIGATAAAESAPIESGGWQWIAPDGQALDEGENEASSVQPNGFVGGGMVKAGTWHWRTIAFDLSETQRGGTIAYTDGAGSVYRWKVPATDSGPEVAAVKKGMEGNY